MFYWTTKMQMAVQLLLLPSQTIKCCKYSLHKASHQNSQLQSLCLSQPGDSPSSPLWRAQALPQHDCLQAFLLCTASGLRIKHACCTSLLKDILDCSMLRKDLEEAVLAGPTARDVRPKL